MSHLPQLSRKAFLRTCGAATASLWLGPGLEAAEDLRLKSWELVELPSLPKKPNPILRITATNGAVGYSKPVAKDIAAAGAVKGVSLLEHEKLHDLMMAEGVPTQQVATLDIAAWDRTETRNPAAAHPELVQHLV